MVTLRNQSAVCMLICKCDDACVCLLSKKSTVLLYSFMSMLYAQIVCSTNVGPEMFEYENICVREKGICLLTNKRPRITTNIQH